MKVRLRYLSLGGQCYCHAKMEAKFIHLSAFISRMMIDVRNRIGQN